MKLRLHYLLAILILSIGIIKAQGTIKGIPIESFNTKAFRINGLWQVLDVSYYIEREHTYEFEELTSSNSNTELVKSRSIQRRILLGKKVSFSNDIYIANAINLPACVQNPTYSFSVQSFDNSIVGNHKLNVLNVSCGVGEVLFQCVIINPNNIIIDYDGSYIFLKRVNVQTFWNVDSEGYKYVDVCHFGKFIYKSDKQVDSKITVKYEFLETVAVLDYNIVRTFNLSGCDLRKDIAKIFSARDLKIEYPYTKELSLAGNFIEFSIGSTNINSIVRIKWKD